jgi:hypothetical protein
LSSPPLGMPLLNMEKRKPYSNTQTTAAPKAPHTKRLVQKDNARQCVDAAEVWPRSGRKHGFERYFWKKSSCHFY